MEGSCSRRAGLGSPTRLPAERDERGWEAMRDDLVTSGAGAELLVAIRAVSSGVEGAEGTMTSIFNDHPDPFKSFLRSRRYSNDDRFIPWLDY
jgi:hypothetical protein